MTQVGTIYSELLKLVPTYHFDKAVNSHQGGRYSNLKPRSLRKKRNRTYLILNSFPQTVVRTI
jgi:hypothetical protein